MNRLIRRAAATLGLLLGFALPASATSTGIDYTDQWWGGQSESGWGVNFIEQGTTIFATLFVYGADGTPRWFVSTMPGTGASFSGPLYSTTGTYYGTSPFNPNIGVNTVGTMSVNFVSGYAGSLQYVINGVTVNKTIVRQSFANNNMAGTYMGGLAASGSSCSSVTNGSIFMNGQVVVTQTNQNLSMAVNFYNANGLATICTFSGTLAAQGVLGQVTNGSFGCVVYATSSGTAANAGSFNLDNMTMTQNGFSAAFTGKDQFCTYNGWFGGIKSPS